MNIFRPLFLLCISLFFNSINMMTGESLNFCPDCSAWITSDCQVDIDGITMHDKEDAFKLQYLNPGDKVDPELAECLNDNLKIVGDLTSYVCLRSQKQGCLVVTNKQQLHIPNALSYACRHCAVFCDCEKMSFNSSAINCNLMSLSVTCVVILFFINLAHCIVVIL